MEFVEAPAFARHRSRYLDDAGFAAFQSMLARAPKSGDVIKATGGLRKIRWSDPMRGKGTRGGLRVIYFHFEEENQIWFLTLYGKDQKDDLSAPERKALKAAIDSEVAARRARGRDH